MRSFTHAIALGLIIVVAHGAHRHVRDVTTVIDATSHGELRFQL